MASMNAERASSSFSATHRLTYEVFLSFRGEDTRTGFTSHLYTALDQKGICTFIDDEKLERGKSISPTLLKAINESRFAIVILSKNYASSTWCLEELEEIIGCIPKTGMIVLPIFYNVNPSDVRNQTGTFKQAFDKHEERFKENREKVQKWRAVLREVANKSGWHLPKSTEAKDVQEIVQEIFNKLNKFIVDTNGVVGINSRAEKLKSLLAIESNDVHIIGIWGMGGMGKTTLARVVYGMVYNQFEACSFIPNVREESEKCNLLGLQKKLLKELLMVKDMNIQDVDHGVHIIKERLCYKKILLVLDDVNNLYQLEKLAGKNDWFGPGSRVIITTRNESLLEKREVNEIYEVEALNSNEAHQLFSLKAFKKDHPDVEYVELSQAFVHYSHGLPLALEVLGSFLFKERKDVWKSALDRLKEYPEGEIIKVLKISYEGLEYLEKEIFLNIACFFCNNDQDSVIKILDYLELHAKIGLKVLKAKSLVKLRDNRLWMHDLLQEMGWDMVRQECPKDPGRRSRLYMYKDINNVLEENTGTKAVQGIVLKLYIPKKVDWNSEAFSKLRYLKLLKIDNVHLMHDLTYLPNSLRFLDWSGYSSKSLPSSFQSNELIELCMCCSYIERLWNGTKYFKRLKFMQLSKSPNLIETPDITEVPVLKELVLEDCINLLEVHPSIGVHKKLKVLNLKGCKNLKNLPRKFEMESLEILILSDCSKVKRIPEFGENMKCVAELYLDGTTITKLPLSIEHLTGLASLILKDCKKLMSLPSTFFKIKSLKNLNLSGCSKLLENFGTAESSLPSSNDLFETLKKLAFSGFKSCYELLPFYSMPLRSPNPWDLLLTSLSNCCSLTNLDLSYCNLNAIPNDIGCLSSLGILKLGGNNFDCLPESIAQLSNLNFLNVEDCTSLQSLPKLPMNINCIGGFGCTSLESVPNLLKPNSLREPNLFLSDCSKLINNQGLIDMFFAVIRKHLQGLSLDDRIYNIVIPGSEIPEWFSNQSIGGEVNTQEPSHLCYEWMGLACCAVISLNHQAVDYSSPKCRLTLNGELIFAWEIFSNIKILSDHLWLIYFTSQIYDECVIKSLSECDGNGFIQFGFKIGTKRSRFKGKKCGLRMVYKKDIEDLNRTMAQSSNTSIVPYEGLGVLHHNIDNSAVVAAGNKAKRTRDDYEGAGPNGEHPSPHKEGNKAKRTRDDYDGARSSGEGSSSDIPNPISHGNSDSEESSEYNECDEELSQWEESNESNPDG